MLLYCIDPAKLDNGDIYTEPGIVVDVINKYFTTVQKDTCHQKEVALLGIPFILKVNRFRITLNK